MLVTLVLHFSIIANPTEPVFDEYHYVTDARSIIQEHESERTEHPPLGKLLITSSIALFGDNPVGWRAFSVLFGTANILLLYLICRNLMMSVRTSNLAIFLLTFENLSFVQSSVAMRSEELV